MFFPNNMLQHEIKLFKNFPSEVQEPTQRQELTVDKLSQVCSIDPELTKKLMIYICKGIGFFLRTENKSVAIDFKLTNNECVLFEPEKVSMVDRKDCFGAFTLKDPRLASGFVKRSQRYNISDLMKASTGLINSPQTPRRGLFSLKQHALAQLPSDEKVIEEEEEQQSIRSKARSLSIQVARVS